MLIQRRGLYYLPMDTLAEYESGHNIIGFAGTDNPEEPGPDHDYGDVATEAPERHLCSLAFAGGALTAKLWHRRTAHMLGPHADCTRLPTGSRCMGSISNSGRKARRLPPATVRNANLFAFAQRRQALRELRRTQPTASAL